MNYFINIIFLFCVGIGFSQIKINQEQAFELAKNNNLSQKLLNLQETRLAKLIGSHRVVSPLAFSVEYGQMNSIYKDNRVSVMQAFQLPKFYSSQKNVLEMELKNFGTIKKMKAWELKKSINLLYNEGAFLNQKLKFIQKIDSLYLNYLNRTQARLKYGETNILEQSLAENWKSQSFAQKESLKKDLELLNLKLNFIINQSDLYEFIYAKFQLLAFDFFVEEQLDSEFFLEPFQNEIRLQEAHLVAEKAKYLPSFSIAANSMSMFGTGANNVTYNFSQRFQSVALGINLPLFNPSKTALIETRKINQLIAKQDLENQKMQLDFELKNKKIQYDKWMAEIKQYEIVVKKNQEKIMQTATRQLQQGEIQYLEWFILISQQFDNESRHWDRIKTTNDLIIEMKALLQPQN